MVLSLLAITGTPAFGQWTPSNMTDAFSGPYQRSLVTHHLTDCGGILFFAAGKSAFDSEPCVSFGSFSTTYQLVDIVPGDGAGSKPEEFTRVGNTVFFAATDEDHGRELWKTDVTTLATTLVKNIRPGSGSSNPHSLAALNGKLIFAAESDPAALGDELWISDGTEAGTTLLKDIAPGEEGSQVEKPVAINGLAYFHATDDPHGADQLWRTDGSAAGTIKLFVPSMGNFPHVRGFTSYNGSVYCVMEDENSGTGWALWKTNGQVAGTSVVKSPVTGANSDGGSTAPDRIVVVNGLMFFRGGSNATGYELWRSDGTAAGTVLIKDIRVGDSSSNPRNLVAYKNAVYFVANDGARGDQIWKSDGTEGGTSLVHEVYNSASSPPPSPQGLCVFGGHLFIKMDRDGYGREWWVSDGTTLSSSPAFELNVGSGNGGDGIYADSSPYHGEFVVSGTGMYFPGYHPTVLGELFRLGMPLVLATQPQPRIAALGSAVSFTATPAGGAIVDYRWTKNGIIIPGASASTYTIPAAAAAHAGRYRATLSGVDGNAQSNEVKLAVVNTVLPTLRVAKGGTIVLTVSATAPTGTTLTYTWRNGGNIISNVTGRISGATTNRLVILRATDLDEGNITCTVGMDSLTLTTNAADVKVVEKPVVADVPVPQAIVSGAFGWQLGGSEYPTGFTVTGLPSGLKYNPATGLVSGIPNVKGTFKVKVTARNVAGTSVVKEFTLVIGELSPGAIGSFRGIVARNAGLNASLGGIYTATVTSSGTFSGALRLGAISHPFKGRLVAPLSGNPASTVTIVRKGLPSLTISLVYNVSANSLTGTVGDGGTTAAIDAWRKVWTAAIPATPYAGTYNVALDIPPGRPDAPQGMSWARVTITTLGAVTISGRMSDGGILTNSSSLWPDGRYPFFNLLNANRGSIRGLQQINAGGAAPEYADNRVASSNLDWQKTGPASSTDRKYKTGFALLSLTSDGSKWKTPPLNTNVLRVASAPGNALVEFSEGGLSTAAQASRVNQIFQLTGTNVAKFTAANNPCRVAITFYPAYGTFSGVSYLSDPNPSGGTAVLRSVAISGIVLPHTRQGWGYFLLAGMPNPNTVPKTTLLNSDILSGLVYLAPR